MSRSLVTVALVLALVGCAPKPFSLVGEWKYSWTGKTNGTDIETYRADGTYTNRTEVRAPNVKFSVRTEKDGTYTYAASTVTLHPMRHILERVSPEGAVTKHVNLELKDHTLKLYDVTNDHFTETGEIPGTAGTHHVYERQ